jgi:toxin ParE1/3/4
MTRKPVSLRPSAQGDIADAIRFYRDEAGERIAGRLADALTRLLVEISEHPGLGSPHYAHLSRIEGLRSRLVRGFPYLVFYVDQAHEVDVWRVLHAHRDIPARLQEP